MGYLLMKRKHGAKPFLFCFRALQRHFGAEVGTSFSALDLAFAQLSTECAALCGARVSAGLLGAVGSCFRRLPGATAARFMRANRP